jgi:hypothetical protein
MTRAGGTAELHVLLREALRARLAEAGWVPDHGQRTDPDAYDVAALRRPVADDFAATASFSRARSLSERPPLWVTGVEVGVSYEPLQRLWPLLVERPPSGELATDVEELLASPRELAVKVFRAADVAAAADDLAAPVLEHAVAYARRYASVDALVAAHLADEDVDAEDEEDPLGVSRAVPALLAAAGRFDEARAALAGYAPEGPDDHRFVRQLTRWLDAGGELPLPPRAVPPAHPERKTFAETRAEGHVQRDAVQGALDIAAGQPRSALRAALEAELQRRELTQSPLWIEHKLDQMQASPGTRAIQTARAFKALGAWGIGLAKMVREGTAPGQPEWLAPPARAAYPTPTGRAWTAVDLDERALDWLDRVHGAALNRVGDTATVDAWLAWDPEHPAIDQRLSVHIGERRVGYLGAAAATSYRRAMDAAALHDEQPRLPARVTTRPSPQRYLLEIPIPTP